MKIEFRNVLEKDRTDIFEYASDLKTVKFLPWGPIKSLADINIALIQSHESQAVICNGKMIGTFSIVKKLKNKWEIGYVLNSKYWNKGIGSIAIKHLIIYIHNKYPNVKHLFAKTEIKNIASQKLLIKHNFVFREEKNNLRYFDFWMT